MIFCSVLKAHNIVAKHFEEQLPVGGIAFKLLCDVFTTLYMDLLIINITKQVIAIDYMRIEKF